MIRHFCDPDFPFMERLKELSGDELEYLCLQRRSILTTTSAPHPEKELFVITRQR